MTRPAPKSSLTDVIRDCFIAAERTGIPHDITLSRGLRVHVRTFSDRFEFAVSRMSPDVPSYNEFDACLKNFPDEISGLVYDLERSARPFSQSGRNFLVSESFRYVRDGDNRSAAVKIRNPPKLFEI